MDKRTRIGLIFSYDENWIGGAYYILNIVHALNTLTDNKKPHIVILSFKQADFEVVEKETNYPYLSFFSIPPKARYNLIERVINKIARSLTNKNIIVNKPIQPDIEVLYPNEYEFIQIEGLKKINWIPDFQEAFLPQYFSDEKIEQRKNFQENIVCKGDYVVFSSNNALEHFRLLYPDSKIKTRVINFAVTHPNYNNESISELKNKFNLTQNYFFAPNQFWAHKNHKTILKAVKHLKDQKNNIIVAFSGKEHDHRNKEYVDDLKKYIKENNLESNIKFLGFIERTEQLCLIENSVAIIQPSLFEGWSTVVEDAKSIGKHIILSNIDVHREQIRDNVTFFNPYDFKELANQINHIHQYPIRSVNRNYDKEIQVFGNNFLQLINEVKIT